MRVEFYSPALAPILPALVPVLVGAISSPLRTESAKRPHLRCHSFGANDATRAPRAALPPQGEVFYRAAPRAVLLPLVSALLRGPHLLAAKRGVHRPSVVVTPSSWARSPRHQAGSQPSGCHRRCHNFGANEAAWISGRLGVLLPVIGARLWGRHLLAPARGVRRAAPIATNTIWRR